MLVKCISHIAQVVCQVVLVRVGSTAVPGYSLLGLDKVYHPVGVLDPIDIVGSGGSDGIDLFQLFPQCIVGIAEVQPALYRGPGQVEVVVGQACPGMELLPLKRDRFR